MPRYICKLDNKYFEWSSIVDGEVTGLMTLDEFKKYYEGEYGKSSMSDLKDRLLRVEEKGTSAHHYDSIDDLIPKKEQKRIIKSL